MHGFPALDGIPLPAPVWLFKLLHILLLSLHFVAVQFVLGALLVAAGWEYRGQRGDDTRRTGARQLARWLPTVMTFLINLGVPPLLFAQVLYGTALYTSSTLIGVYWISVIGWLLVMYSLIYVGQFRSVDRRPWAAHAAIALLIGLVIASIYSTNMVLMLRPDTWARLYRQGAMGLNFPFQDLSIWPRTLFMASGGLVIVGLSLIMLGAAPKRSPELRTLMLHEGGLVAVVGAVAQLVLSALIVGNLRANVAGLLAAHPLYHTAELAWLALWLVTVLLAAAAAFGGPPAVAAGRSLKLFALAAPLVGVLLTVAMVTVRDGIRDLTLLQAGFDVWSLDVAVNPGVLTIFLVLVVLAVAIVGALIAIALRAKPVEELAES